MKRNTKASARMSGANLQIKPLTMMGICVAALSFLTPAYGQVSVGQWKIHQGGGRIDMATPNLESQKKALDDAKIPTQNDPGWIESTALSVDVDVPSVLNGQNKQVDYMFFQVLVNVPKGTTVDKFQVKFDQVDDAARVSIFNNKNPNGKSYPAADVIGKASNLTVKSDFVNDVVEGENRVVITQYDWAPSGNHIKGIRILVNGSEVAPKKVVQAPKNKETPIVSVSAGEVHIKTPDGLAYDFQGTGEFLCAQSDDKKAIVQSRQEPWPGNPTLSINTAAAISADGNKFEFYLKPKFRWFVNDEEQPAPGANGGGSSAYPGGTRLNYTVLGAGLVEYIIYWSDKSFAARVMVTESAKISYMDIGIRRDSEAHTYQGMFGNIDKNPKNDMTLRNGDIVTPPASIADLNRFTDSWRLTAEESLFGDAQRDQKKEALAKSSHTEVKIPQDKWDAAETEVKGAGITSPIVVRNATYDVALTGDKSFIKSAKVEDAAVNSLPPAERTLVAGDAANKVAVEAENKAVATLIATAGAAPTPSSKGATLTFEWSGEVGNDASVPLTPGGEAFGNSGWMLNGNALPAKTALKFTYTIPDTAKDTDGTPGAGRYTGGTLNVSIPSLGVNSTPAKAYDLVFGTDGSSDFVLAQPSDNTGFALVGNWPATADPWPNPNVLSPIANPKAINIIGTSPDGKFTLTLQSGHELTTASTELLANPVFSSSSSAKPTPVPATGNALVLAPGSAMNVKQKYWSENKEFYAIFQPDGNFGVSTKNDGYKWDIVTKKKTPLYAKTLLLNPTGNLVFLDKNDKLIWSIDKLITPVANSTLNLSNSGDLLLIAPGGAVLWDSSK